MTTHSPLLLCLAAFALTACAMAVARPGVIPRDPGSGPQPSLACVLETAEQGGTVTFDAIVTAGAAQNGSYDLTVRGASGQVAIAQSGPFVASAGQTLNLGMASVSGRARDYRAALVLTTDGTAFACPSRP
jgi:hypothetical protein